MAYRLAVWKWRLVYYVLACPLSWLGVRAWRAGVKDLAWPEVSTWVWRMQLELGTLLSNQGYQLRSKGLSVWAWRFEDEDETLLATHQDPKVRWKEAAAAAIALLNRAGGM